MRSRPLAAVPSSSDRVEPSLSEAAPLRPAALAERGPYVSRTSGRAAAAVPDLRAGERVVVASTLGASLGEGTLMRNVAFVVLAVLALVGAFSLLRGFVGL